MSQRTADARIPGSTTRSDQDRSARDQSERIKLRRGLTYLGMTLVLPGSAQLTAGNRRVGRIAIRIWAGLWAAVVLVALLALVWRGGAISLLAFPPTLRIVQVVLAVLGLGWGGLLVDAWRIARPPELARQHRLGFAIFNMVLVFVVVGGLLASSSIVSSQREFMASVFAGGGDREAKDGRINVLLLGGDAGKNRVGLRPDSLTVASIDEETGRTVLFSLPRNMEDVPFPKSSPMHKEFPKGFTCEDHSCMLNAVYTYATEHKDKLYPGVKDPGVVATREAVEGVTGLKINYYAMVDLHGFTSLVDAVGGITMDVNRRIPIGGGSTKVKSYIEPGKNVHLDGYHALWFARSRHGSSDYERMARQKCVMSAMLNQLDPLTVVTKFNQIASAGKEIVETDVSTSQIDPLMKLAVKAKELPVSSVSFVPPLVYPGNPKFDVVQQTVKQKIAASEAADRGEPTTPPKKKSTSEKHQKQQKQETEPVKAPASKAPADKGSAKKESGQQESGQTTDKPEQTRKPKAEKTPDNGSETKDLQGVCSAT